MAAPQRQWAAHSELHPTVLVKILYCQCYSLISNSCMTKISFVEEELNLIELNNQYNKENFSFCIITKFTKLKTSNYKICIEKIHCWLLKWYQLVLYSYISPLSGAVAVSPVWLSTREMPATGWWTPPKFPRVKTFTSRLLPPTA